ncbi:acyltransferase [Frankia sp. R82]|uniref:acyltransferase family protein n=1 Tax=Frankia sp. R82 TaxID=2950553 RepID=UPI0020443E4F|nr:acyltransferase [Frankia sp. R82]MCM3882886.1 acyltransferase [Frankia sp. R82]
MTRHRNDRPQVRRGGRNPALDGVRGLAVLAVLVFHMDSLRGGHLGVDVFFVLSGFLITGQLLAEQDRTGRVSFTRFYLRRAYRLLPAFLLLIAVAATAVLVLGISTAAERSSFRGSLASSLLYVNNYVQVGSQSTGAGWLGHTWSLSLEEQFYLLWPLLLVLACRWGQLARRLPAALLAGAVAVLVWRDLLIAHGATGRRMYFALDTRADALLVGCALAAWLRVARAGVDGEGAAGLVWRRRVDRVRAALPVVGPVALALLAVGALKVPADWGPHPALLSHGGYTVVALVAGALVLALELGSTSSWLFRGLAAAPLAWLGRISYGFYLWHFPVVAHWGPDLADALGRWPAIVLVALISVALASASYYLLELPIQRHRPADARPRVRPAAVQPRPADVGVRPGAERVRPGAERVRPGGERVRPGGPRLRPARSAGVSPAAVVIAPPAFTVTAAALAGAGVGAGVGIPAARTVAVLASDGHQGRYAWSTQERQAS